VSVVVTSGWHPDHVEQADPELLARQVGGEPDEDRWLTVQVAALHGYLFDLSEADVLDQAGELSALIPAIAAQLHQDGDTVLMLETTDRLAPFDWVALLGATLNLLDRTAEPLRERLAYALADHLPPVEADQAEPPALEHPQHCWCPLDNGIVVRPCDSSRTRTAHGGHPNSGTPFNSRCCHRAVSCPQHHAAITDKRPSRR
jgi:hypothetical protein